MRKELVIVMMIGAIILILSGKALAIGVSPGRTTINFESEAEKEVPLTIINNDKQAMTVVIYIRGELKEYIKLSQETLTFAQGEETKSISYKVKLPKSFEKPGVQSAEIVVMEVREESKIKTDKGEVIIVDSPAINARLAVISQLYVYVLHPGKYLETTIEAIPNEGKTRFIIPITSRGKLGIGAASATIDIYAPNNERVATIKTNTESVQSEERKELFASWDHEQAQARPGKYRAVATTTYDGETAYADKEFEIGIKKLEIENIEVNDFKLGEIAKFNILVNNEWSEKMNEVNVRLEVYNKEGQTMADFTSANYEVPPLSKKELLSYWDTTGVDEGKYEGRLTLNYDGKSEERQIMIEISKKSIEVEGFTGKAVFSTDKKLTTQNILIGVVILLVIINAVWFFLFLRKKKKAASS
jgi:hypothetical protein